MISGTFIPFLRASSNNSSRTGGGNPTVTRFSEMEPVNTNHLACIYVQISVIS